jgi:formylmethanofuran dehydrogenase subunit C
MPLTLTLKTSTTVPLEVEGLTPDVTGAMSLAEVEKFSMFHGNAKVPLAEFFRASGDPSDRTIVFEGDVSGVHWIGAKMTSGTIRIEGKGGRHIGSQMRGGEIHVSGDAGDWVGGEMRGGLIHVRGRAGHLIGAAYRGSAKGMTRGTILIHGDAGNEIGHTLRRGLIIIGGNVGDFVGFNMLAGTILVGGEPGIRHGAGMRRGTIGFFGGHRPVMLPSFRRACRYQPPYLPLLWRDLAAKGFPVPADSVASEYDLFAGDLIEGGRGEILLRAA